MRDGLFDHSMQSMIKKQDYNRLTILGRNWYAMFSTFSVRMRRMRRKHLKDRLKATFTKKLNLLSFVL